MARFKFNLKIPRRPDSPDPDSYRDHRDRDCLGCSVLIIWLCKEPRDKNQESGRALVSCPDASGLVA